MKVVVQLPYERETKRTYLFRTGAEGVNAGEFHVTSVYVSKQAFGRKAPPKSVTVTVEG